jgi:hypothetical protein
MFDISNNSKGPNTHDGERIDMGEPSRSGEYSLANCYFYRKVPPKAALKPNKSWSSCYKGSPYCKASSYFHRRLSHASNADINNRKSYNKTIWYLGRLDCWHIYYIYIYHYHRRHHTVTVFKVLFIIFWWERRLNKKCCFYSAIYNPSIFFVKKCCSNNIWWLCGISLVLSSTRSWPTCQHARASVYSPNSREYEEQEKVNLFIASGGLLVVYN